MKIIDLTTEITGGVSRTLVPIRMKDSLYQGIIHNLVLSSMSGTYLDLPGHILEFDNRLDAGNYPLEKLFMVPTTVIRLKREGLGREIRAEELKATGISVKGKGLIIDTGWNPRSIDSPEVYFYGKDAVGWIISQEIDLFISDVYENHADPRGIFVELFKAGISCVCIPVNLDKISKEEVKICVVPLKIPGVVQLPCRLLAIEE
ncbi:MAG: cyclase family protein [Candidatus Omnitrophota bacterium]